MKTAPAIVSSYFDGDLSAAEQAELRAWMLDSSANVKSFVLLSIVHSQLIDFMGPESSQANAIVAAAEISSTPATVRAAASGYRRVFGALAVAAILFCVATLTYFYAARPEVVASVNGTQNVQWAAGTTAQTVGGLLHAGDGLAIDGGLLHIVFARGGQVALQGPAKFRIESDKAGRLLAGSLSVLAPEHAVGFTIYGGRLTAVDLGTEFHLQRLPDDSCVLHVFDGLVEIQLDARSNGGGGKEKLQIPEGRAIRFDAASGKVASIEYDKSKRLVDTIWSR